ncbi:MAG: hypothetical protein V9E94_10785 [Microthrixaceae bacterium]
MPDNPIPERYRTDFLFLLIGTNPLPNFVAATLLARDNSTIYLLHSNSADAPSTQQFATFLQAILKKHRPQLTIIPRGISEADGQMIPGQMRTILNDAAIPSDSQVGLNYTGGTKPMAVHTYRALVAGDRPYNVSFSYLDARKLALYFDDSGMAYGVANHVALSLEDLAGLHGYELLPKQSQPLPLELAQALRKVHQTKNGIQQWRRWLNPDLLDLPEEQVLAAMRTAYQERKLYADVQKMLNETMALLHNRLPEREQFPQLGPVIDVFATMCEGVPEATKVAQMMGVEKLSSLSKWFWGGWLEDIVLQAIQQNQERFAIQESGLAAGVTVKPGAVLLSSIKTQPKPKDFELDVIVLVGYQLFVISCIARDKADGETKNHLFQAYVRARQLGGDEARVGLVCLADNPQAVQNELEREWQTAGSLRVFGRSDLADLAGSLRQWFAPVKG